MTDVGSAVLHQPPVQLRPPVAEEAERRAVALDPVEVERGGDHALFLMIFAGFALRYLPRWAGVVAVVMVPLFSAPRILAGAHWMTDVYVGALCLSLICLPLLLLTHVSDRLIDRLAPRLPRWIA